MTYIAPRSESSTERTAAWKLQRQRNLRVAWILASIAATFFVGFLAKMAFFGA